MKEYKNADPKPKADTEEHGRVYRVFNKVYIFATQFTRIYAALAIVVGMICTILSLFGVNMPIISAFLGKK